MKLGKGIVKKYSREYNRTLKSGEKKKYKTEQIQITIPKSEDIYENKEEVLIIPNSEIENFKNQDEELATLQIANYLYTREVGELENHIETTQKPSTLEYENEIEHLLKQLDEQNQSMLELEKLKKENDALRNDYDSLKESYDQTSRKYDQLKQENLNTKTSYAEIYEINEELEKDYENLRQDYNKLVDMYNDLEEELYNMKTSKSQNELLANRVKEFMLKRID